MKKVMLVFGTRAEAVKMASVVKEFQRRNEEFDTVVCVTAGHREKFDGVLRLFDIVPDYTLADGDNDAEDVFDETARVLVGMREVLTKAQPDVVLVQGDSTASAAAAQAAYFMQIPVAHIEAGLRTHDIYSPWPEELNRQMIDRVAAYHFAPTLQSKQNLLQEGINPDTVVVTGNTVIDALRKSVSMVKMDEKLDREMQASICESGYDTTRLDAGRQLVLITAHRHENYGEGFVQMCAAFKALAEKYPEVDFVYPLSRNPKVIEQIEGIFADKQVLPENLFVIPSLYYPCFVYMMERSTLVLTDSGGLQEEAPALDKPVLVMRDSTERPEAVAAGTVKLIGNRTDKIVAEVARLLDDVEAYDKMKYAINPYGDGIASVRIVNAMA